MTVKENLTEFAEVDCLDHDWDTKHGWWTGWIGRRVQVLPLSDVRPHVSPNCACRPTFEVLEQKVIVVHNAFDGREAKEAS